MLERLAEERLLGDGFGPRVERRELEFLERLRPPIGHQAPAHGHAVALVVALDHHVDRVGGADVVARLRVARRRVERQPIEPHDLGPGQPVGEATAHERNIVFLVAITTRSTAAA